MQNKKHNNIRKGFLLSLTFIISIFSLTSCSHLTLDDVIPKEYGGPDELVLYKKEFRCSTDGKHRSPILNTLNLGGIEYLQDQYIIQNISYITKESKIFFALSVGEDQYIYIYDYQFDIGRELNKIELTSETNFYQSNNFIYLKTSKIGLLYDFEGNLLCDKILGTLDQEDLLYGYSEKEDAFMWYFDGVYREVTDDNPWCFDSRYFHHFDKYVYFLTQTSGIVVDLESGECFRPDLLNRGPNRFYHDNNANIMHYSNGTLYLLVVFYKDIPDSEDMEWLTYLYKISGGLAEVEYDFGNARWGAEIIGSDENKIYFRAGYNGKNKYFAYDLSSSRMKKVSKAPKPSIEKPKRKEIKVKDYIFYTGVTTYTIPSGFMGFEYRYCYYLYREYQGKKDIMQYSLTSSYFFDDIREF